jgi:hypothetical protein
MNCNPPLRGPLSGDRDTPQPNLPAQSRRRPIGRLLSPEESDVARRGCCWLLNSILTPFLSSDRVDAKKN